MVTYNLMTLRDLERVTGLRKTKIYDLMNPASAGFDPEFPTSIALSNRCVRWRSDEIQAYLDKKSATRSIEPQGNERRAKALKAAKAKASLSELAGQA